MNQQIGRSSSLQPTGFKAIKSQPKSFEQFQDFFLSKIQDKGTPFSSFRGSDPSNASFQPQKSYNKRGSLPKGLTLIPFECMTETDNKKNKIRETADILTQEVGSGKKIRFAKKFRNRTESFTNQEMGVGKHLTSLSPFGGFTEVLDFREGERKFENNNLLETHLKAEHNTVLPFVKRFINKLKAASSIRDISILKPIALKIFSDRVFFFDDFQKKQEIIHATNPFIRFFLTLRNFYDSKLFEIKKGPLMYFWKECVLGSKMVFHPYHYLKIIWDILHLLLMIGWFFYIPLLMAFEEIQQFDEIVSFFTCIFLIIDIFVSANTAYFKNGMVERNRKKVVSHYITTKFFVDVATVFPTVIEQILLKKYDLSSYGEFFYFHLVKFIFFLKIKRINEITHRINQKFILKEQFQNILSLLKIFFISILIAHLFACFWYFASKHSGEELTWLVKANLGQSNWGVRYLYSMYWACVTMMTVGYGDITPQNEVEIIVCMISVLIGCGVYAYNISSIGMLLQDLNKENSEFEHKINIINQYMSRKRINRDLQMRIREYLRFIWREENTQNLEDEQRIIGLLSNALREELLIQAYGEILKRYPMFFANFTEKSLRKVVSIIKDIKLFPEEKIFHEDEIDDCSIYFIMKGKVELYTESGIQIKELGVGEHFGEIAFFSGKERKLSARSKDFTTLFSINRHEFIEVLMKNSDDMEKFCMIKDQMIFYGNYFPLKLHCYSCNQIGHLCHQCPLMHFLPDKEKIIKKFNFYFDQDRNPNFERKALKRNSRYEKKKLVWANKRIKIKLDNEKALFLSFIEGEEDTISMNSSERSLFENLEEAESNAFEAGGGITIGTQVLSTEKTIPEGGYSTHTGKSLNERDKNSLTNIAEENSGASGAGEEGNKEVNNNNEINSVKKESHFNIITKDKNQDKVIFKSADYDDKSFASREEIRSDNSLPKQIAKTTFVLNKKQASLLTIARKPERRPFTEIEIIKRSQLPHLPQKNNPEIDPAMNGMTESSVHHRTKKVSSGYYTNGHPQDEGRLALMNNSLRATSKQNTVISQNQPNFKAGEAIHSHRKENNHQSVSSFFQNSEAALDNFDRVASFKNYFPDDNSKFLFEVINRKLTRMRSRSLRMSLIRKRSLDGKLSKYTFFPEMMKQKMPNEILRKVRKASKLKKKKKTEEIISESQFKDKWFEKSQSKLMRTKKTKTMLLSGRFFEDKFSDLVKYIMKTPNLKRTLKKQKRKESTRSKSKNLF